MTKCPIDFKPMLAYGPPRSEEVAFRIILAALVAPGHMADESAHSYLVLKDQLEFCRGSLVRWERGSQYVTHSHVLTMKHGCPVTIATCDLAPLTKKQCVILDAMANNSSRYTLYKTPGKLVWAAGLKVGDLVLAQLPDRSGRGPSGGGQGVYTAAILRWAGMTDGGWTVYHFGVEIMVRWYRTSVCNSTLGIKIRICD